MRGARYANVMDEATRRELWTQPALTDEHYGVPSLLAELRRIPLGSIRTERAPAEKKRYEARVSVMRKQGHQAKTRLASGLAPNAPAPPASRTINGRQRVDFQPVSRIPGRLAVARLSIAPFNLPRKPQLSPKKQALPPIAEA